MRHKLINHPIPNDEQVYAIPPGLKSTNYYTLTLATKGRFAYFKDELVLLASPKYNGKNWKTLIFYDDTVDNLAKELRYQAGINHEIGRTNKYSYQINLELLRIAEYVYLVENKQYYKDEIEQRKALHKIYCQRQQIIIDYLNHESNPD